MSTTRAAKPTLLSCFGHPSGKGSAGRLAFAFGISHPGRPPGSLIALVGFLLIGLVGLVNYGTGPEFTFSIFYLIPIALGAWWGGFAWGVLFSLASTLAWHFSDLAGTPHAPLVICLWNGVVRFGFFAVTTRLIARLQTAMLREQALARSDPLTGVANGRTFYEEAHQEIQRFGRTLRPLTLVYLDLDHFKEVNDRLGHPLGDMLLRQVAETIQKNTRVTDLVARLGGDEFAVLLPETEAAGAEALLAKLRDALREEMAQNGWAVTCSIGAATFMKPPARVDVMVRCVDALMYQVKRGGKNCSRHTVVEEAEEILGGDGPKVEQRAEVRILCNRPARVQSEGAPTDPDRFGTVRDISTSGIGVRLGYRLKEGTVLTVEQPDSRLKTLLARVVWSTSEGNGWLHGCELANRLSEEKLQNWLT